MAVVRPPTPTDPFPMTTNSNPGFFLALRLDEIVRAADEEATSRLWKCTSFFTHSPFTSPFPLPFVSLSLSLAAKLTFRSGASGMDHLQCSTRVSTSSSKANDLKISAGEHGLENGRYIRGFRGCR